MFRPNESIFFLVISKAFSLISAPTPTENGKYFKDFEKHNKKENEKFVWIYDYKQVIGMRFDRIEKVYDWYKMKNASEILEGVEIRLRSNYA